MAVTLSSWKQILEAKQGFDFPRHHVVVTPKGCICLGMNNAILVRDEEEVPKLVDSDKVKINEECCCPPIEFNLVMGQDDTHRPGVSRPAWARFTWITNVPTYATVQWRLSGGTTWPNEVSATLEERAHEYFDYGLVPRNNYEFRILAYRDFCGDGTTSQIYTFTVCGASLYIDATPWSWTVTKTLYPSGGTTFLYSPFTWVASTGAVFGAGDLTNTVSTSLITSVETSSLLDDTYLFTSASATSVP